MGTKDKNISLKEAARISGYSPDYIGQLIRKGKLPGKQVFSNVSWVTTEDAIREYIEKDKKQRTSENLLSSLKERLFSVETLSRIYTVVALVIIAVLSIFALFLVYVFVTSVDRTIERNIESSIEIAL